MPTINISNQAELSNFLVSNDRNGLITNNIFLNSSFNFISNNVEKMLTTNANYNLIILI